MKICLNCGKELEGKNKNRRNYCSQECYWNKNFPTRSKLRHCLYCNKTLENTASKKYCSTVCQTAYRRNEIILKWRSGNLSGSRGTFGENISNHIRNYLLEQSEYRCSLCGWGEVNEYTGKVPLHIDHINGDSRDNSPQNLRVLCPNCHSLTETFGILNKGNGRRLYRELYHSV